MRARNKIAAALLAVILLAGTVCAAGAETFKFVKGDTVIVNAGGPSRRLNYRAGWGTDYSILRSYEDGTQATVLEVSPKGLWFRCQMPDGRKDGWFWGGYLAKTGSVTVGATHVISNHGMFVNLRSAPGGAVLAKLPDGTKVKVISFGREWAKVECGGTTGSVMSHFLRKV